MVLSLFPGFASKEPANLTFWVCSPLSLLMATSVLPDVVRLVKCSTARKQEEEKEDERWRGIEPGSGRHSSSLDWGPWMAHPSCPLLCLLRASPDQSLPCVAEISVAFLLDCEFLEDKLSATFILAVHKTRSPSPFL